MPFIILQNFENPIFSKKSLNDITNIKKHDASILLLQLLD